MLIFFQIWALSVHPACDRAPVPEFQMRKKVQTKKMHRAQKQRHIFVYCQRTNGIFKKPSLGIHDQRQVCSFAEVRNSIHISFKKKRRFQKKLFSFLPKHTIYMVVGYSIDPSRKFQI